MRIGNEVLYIIAFMLSGISFYVLVRDQKKISKAMVIYSIVATIIELGITWTLINVYKDNSVIFNVKRICMLSILWPVAYTDIKEFRIPNSFIILGLIYRVIVIPFELMTEEYFMVTFVAELIAVVVMLVSTGLCRLCIKNAIGAGDMKLFIVMGCLLGLESIWGAVFISLIISFIVAVVLLITKKKSRNDNIPFGPAIALGTFLSIWLTGM